LASVVVAASTLADLGSGGGPIVDLSYPKAATAAFALAMT